MIMMMMTRTFFETRYRSWQFDGVEDERHDDRVEDFLWNHMNYRMRDATGKYLGLIVFLVLNSKEKLLCENEETNVGKNSHYLILSQLRAPGCTLDVGLKCRCVQKKYTQAIRPRRVLVREKTGIMTNYHGAKLGTETNRKPPIWGHFYQIQHGDRSKKHFFWTETNYERIKTKICVPHWKFMFKLKCTQ